MSKKVERVKTTSKLFEILDDFENRLSELENLQEEIMSTTRRHSDALSEFLEEEEAE